MSWGQNPLKTRFGAWLAGTSWRAFGTPLKKRHDLPWTGSHVGGSKFPRRRRIAPCEVEGAGFTAELGATEDVPAVYPLAARCCGRFPTEAACIG